MSEAYNILDTIMQPQHPDTVLRLSNNEARVTVDSVKTTMDSIMITEDTVKTSDSLPLYYRNTFFSTDSMYNTEIKSGGFGVAGDPMEYSMRADNTLNILLLMSLAIAVVCISNSWSFVVRQVKGYFYISHNEYGSMGETSTEIWFQAFLAMLTCLQTAIVFFSLTVNYVGDTFRLDSQYQLIAIYFALSLAYLLAKFFIGSIVNTVFFGWKKNLQWSRVSLFLTSFAGVLLFPIVLLLVYYGLCMENVAICSISILVIVKILTFYKYYTIFFRQSTFFLQIILYFCALEIVPLAYLWFAMERVANELIIIF